MRPVAYVAHHIPGRIRIRIPQAKHDSALLKIVHDAARAVTGVSAVEFNALTGSVVVHFAPSHNAAIEKLLRDAVSGAVSLQDSRPQRQSARRGGDSRSRRRVSKAAQSMMEFFGTVDDAIRAATDDELDLRTLLPVAVASAGLLAFPRGLSTPLGMTLMIFAFNSFNTLHAGEQAEAFQSAGDAMMG